MIDSRVTEHEGRHSVEAGTPNQETVAGIPHARGQIMSSYPFAQKLAPTLTPMLRVTALNHVTKCTSLNSTYTKVPLRPEILRLNWKVPNAQVKSVPVGGRLKFFLQNWEILTKDKEILQMVKGLKVNWTKIPVQTREPNYPKFGKLEDGKINEEIQKLLQKKAILEVDPMKDQFVSHIFLTPKKDGGGSDR